MSHNLEILLIYRSPQGRETDYFRLSDGSDAMDEGDYEAAAFWQSGGGLSVTRNGHHTVFLGTDFYNTVKAVSFLLHALYKIQHKTSDWFDENEDNAVSVRMTSGDELRLTGFESDTLTLSYLPKENRLHRRGDRYFESETFSKKAWAAESYKALEEYFTVSENVIHFSENDRNIQPMKEFLQVWKLIFNF